MGLCEVCQFIDVRSLLASFHASKYFKMHEEQKSHFIDFDYIFSLQNSQRHHDKFAALRKAAQDCDFCGMVWAYHKTNNQQTDQHVDDKCDCKYYLRGAVRLILYQDIYSPNVTLYVIVMPPKNGPPIEAQAWRVPDGYVAAIFEMCLAKGAQIPPEDEHLLARLARDEQPSDLASELSLSLGETWLRRCRGEHLECAVHDNRQTVLPTRVINVGSMSQEPFLHVSGDSEIGKWVALSYCWGGESPFTLNKNTSSALKSGLPLSDFPPTLRDAILVARVLGVQFIWIDSLCILQDNAEDWAIEASRMGNIYRHATLTIAATSADSVNAGFLDKRKPHFNCALPWNSEHSLLNEPQKDAQKYPIFAREVNATSIGALSSESSWASRGWTLQEELLSPRILQYKCGRMVWQCSKGMAVEPESDASRRSPYFISDLKKIISESENPAASMGEDVQSSSRSTAYRTWYELLSQYSTRSLTYYKDCLPAIAGFAKYFQARLDDQYCVGLWKRDILYGMLWNTGYQKDSSTKSKSFAKARMKISSEDAGPSWSWVTAFGSYLSWPHRYDSYKYEITAKLIDVEVYGATADDFGRISGGKLTLEAPYRDISLKQSGRVFPRSSKLQDLMQIFRPSSKLQQLVQIALDRPEWLAGTQTSRSAIIPLNNTLQRFTLIEVMRQSSESEIWLLLLQPVANDHLGVSGKQVHRRVALIYLKDWAYDDDFTPEEMQTAYLQDAAIQEVKKEVWLRSNFVII